MDSAKQSQSATAKPLARVAVKPEHRLRAAALRPTPSRASSEPPTTIFEERPTIPMWGLTGTTSPARPPAEAKVELFPPPPPPAVDAVIATPVPAAVARPAPAKRQRVPKLESPAFGAGMLKARNVRTDDPMATQRVRAVADGPMFGAHMLSSRTSPAKWVALALALGAVVAIVLAAM